MELTARIVFSQEQTSPSPDAPLASILSHSVDCLFILVMVSFALQKLYSVLQSICLFVLSFPLPEEIYQEKILLRKVSDFTAYVFF